MFTYFKSCHLRVRLPNSLRLGPKGDSSPWNSDILANPQQQVDIKKKTGDLGNYKGSRDNQEVGQG